MDLIKILRELLQGYYGIKTIKEELTIDCMGNPQIIYSFNEEYFYLTHNINEGKFYISKYCIKDTLVIDRITKMTHYYGEDKDFKKFSNELIKILKIQGKI